MVCESPHQVTDLMRSMRKHIALFILATIHLKGSWCCLISKAPLSSCTTLKLQQQIFLLMMNHWVQKSSISVLETFPVLQLIHLSQSTFAISIVRWCLSNSLIKIDILAYDALIDPKEINFYAGNLSYICNWFI